MEKLVSLINHQIAGDGANLAIDSGLEEVNDNESVGSNLKVLDVEDAVKRLGGDRSLFNRFIGIFRDDIPELLSASNAAEIENDLAALGNAAHRIRGIAANLSAHALCDSAKTLEAKYEQNELAESIKQLDLMKREVERLEKEFVRIN